MKFQKAGEADFRITSQYEDMIELCLSVPKPPSVGAMTREQFDAEFQKGVKSIKAGKAYSADEVDMALEKEFGI